MDRIKMGKFIQELRKAKKLTQQDLADKLGVTDKSIGNWENGRNIPDVSLFKPLCEILDITVNELISGERISEDRYQEKLEENIVNTIEYSRERINKNSIIFGNILIVLGWFLTLSSIIIFSFGSIYGFFYTMVGIILYAIGVFHLTYKMNVRKRIIILLSVFFVSIGVLILTDYVSVKLDGFASMFKKYDRHISNESDEIFLLQ